ncbi:MAG: Flp pilus assembly complex ATPase component TadA [Clostridia bacterium]|nr:Flp pilus assembly complex ATPase component TadA [Clostridia bacterium]
MLNRENTSLGEYLIREGKTTKEKYDAAVAESEKSGTSLPVALVESRACSAHDVATALSKIMGIPFMELRGLSLPPEIVKLVPGKVLRQHSVCPIEFADEFNSTIILAMANPLDMAAQDDISLITGCMVEPRVSTSGDINLLLDKYYGSQEAQEAVDKFTKERESKIAALEAQREKGDSELENSPVVQLVRSIFEQSVRKRASDIHIDAHETEVVVRFRIDGALVRVMAYDISMLPVMVTRLKIMGGMDISEKRKPQDGRITIEVDHSEYDVRVSILPTSYGEKVVMRIASTVALTRTKAQLGMREHELTRFDHILSNPNGIILVTGPTGSGKSTTLYTALSALNDEAVNIITVEDPVEANISGINQVQVNNKAGLTFASALRSILRQDPDIIMIGEIRDYETASIAVQASITGHLVVSTLHTNSSAATITRLLDMGVESFLIADSVVGVLAQRLIRKLCPHCKKPREATKDEKELLKYPVDQPLTIYEPGGCSMCNETGFFGRTGVYEIMEMSPKLKHLVTIKSNTETLKDAALEEGMHTLRMSAAQYVIEGVTTIRELLKVSMEE